jgi:hypothetical protein
MPAERGELRAIRNPSMAAWNGSLYNESNVQVVVVNRTDTRPESGLK